MARSQSEWRNGALEPPAHGTGESRDEDERAGRPRRQLIGWHRNHVPSLELRFLLQTNGDPYAFQVLAFRWARAEREPRCQVRELGVRRGIPGSDPNSVVPN